MNTVFVHWKSTLSGALTALIGACPLIIAAKANPTAFPEYAPFVALLSTKVVGIIAGFALAGKLYVAAVQKDADKTLANVPGMAEPQVVSAHLVPDNPTETAVVEKPQSTTV